jgi:hypothetical protein
MLTQPGEMIKRFIVKGYNKKIFFAAREKNVEKIYVIEPGMKRNEIIKKQIFKIPQA